MESEVSNKLPVIHAPFSPVLMEGQIRMWCIAQSSTGSDAAKSYMSEIMNHEHEKTIAE